MILGFSTGSLAKGDFRKALQMLENTMDSQAIELSALRESELSSLVEALPFLELRRYKYISVHAPSKLTIYSEEQVITLLTKIISFGFPIVVHPDIIKNFEKWRPFGKFLCIENMDKRKPIGRTAEDLERLFMALPEASFCLDLAHAKQVDPSMVECVKMLRLFRSRLIQFHISDVTSDSSHVPINIEAIEAFRTIANLIPQHIPFIIESPVPASYIYNELKYISSIFHINNHYNNNHHPFITDNPDLFIHP